MPCLTSATGRRQRQRQHQRDRRAFSLVELLVVVAILSLLAAIMTPAVKGIVDSSQLNVAAGLVDDTLNLARQTALGTNRTVEVRFYKVPRKGGAGHEAYRGLAVFRLEDTGPAQVGNFVWLEGNVQLADDGTHGTLLHHTEAGRGAMPGAGADPAAEFTYRHFLIRADGSTNLPVTTPPAGSGDTWHTVLYNAGKPLAEALDGNYATIQLDPETGRSRILRPGS
jgi:uncharacterized protein (TIGR02596 family)